MGWPRWYPGTEVVLDGPSAPGEPVGLLSKHTLLGGLVYYGGREVVPLRSEADVAAFLAEGERAIVLRERDLPALSRQAQVEVRARARGGARALLVVTARGEPPG